MIFARVHTRAGWVWAGVAFLRQGLGYIGSPRVTPARFHRHKRCDTCVRIAVEAPQTNANALRHALEGYHTSERDPIAYKRSQT